MKKKMIVSLFILLGFFVKSSFDSAFAEAITERNTGWGGGVHLGFSPYLGLIGAELQHTNFGLTLGFPGSIGVRYYFDPKGTQWFLGTHILHYERDEDETKDGILYTEQKTTLTGMGIGYKWRWKHHWDLTLSLSLVYEKEKLKNNTVTRIDESFLSIPGITFGYSY